MTNDVCRHHGDSSVFLISVLATTSGLHLSTDQHRLAMASGHDGLIDTCVLGMIGQAIMTGDRRYV